MKKICIEVNFFEDEELIMKCPFCEQVIQNDEITTNGTELEINACPHTLFWAIDDSVHFQTPQFEDILIKYPDDDDEQEALFDDQKENHLILEDGYLDTDQHENIHLYEINDCSPGPFQTYTIFYFGFINDEPEHGE